MLEGRHFYGYFFFFWTANSNYSEANDEGKATYRSKHLSFKAIVYSEQKPSVFVGFCFLSNISLTYEMIRQKNPQYQSDKNRRLIAIKIKRCEFDSYRFIGHLDLSASLKTTDSSPAIDYYRVFLLLSTTIAFFLFDLASGHPLLASVIQIIL